MRKRRFYFWALPIALALAGVLIWTIWPSEPSYQGKSLSQWLRHSQPPELRTPESDEAIRNIGTNAIPYLLQWIAYRTPGWKIKFYISANSVLSQLSSSWKLPDGSQYRRADAAFRALLLLGTNADAELPAVMNILNAKDTPFHWDRAVRLRTPVSASLKYIPFYVEQASRARTLGSLPSLDSQRPALARLLDAYEARMYWRMLQPLLTNQSSEFRTFATNFSWMMQHDGLDVLLPAAQ